LQILEKKFISKVEKPKKKKKKKHWAVGTSGITLLDGSRTWNTLCPKPTPPFQKTPVGWRLAGF
jgi:hypothetical protein